MPHAWEETFNLDFNGKRAYTLKIMEDYQMTCGLPLPALTLILDEVLKNTPVEKIVFLHKEKFGERTGYGDAVTVRYVAQSAVGVKGLYRL